MDGFTDADKPARSVNTAAWVLETFQQATEGEDETLLTDLLADLMHWAAANGQSFPAALHSADIHYQGEIPDDDDEDDTVSVSEIEDLLLPTGNWTEMGDVTTPTGSGSPADEDLGLLGRVFGDAISYRIPDGDSDEDEDYEIAELYYALADRLGVTPV